MKITKAVKTPLHSYTTIFAHSEIKTLENSSKTNHKIINEHLLENIIVKTENAINNSDLKEQDTLRTLASMEITKFIKTCNNKK